MDSCVGASQSSCPSTWVARAASKSVQMFSFSLLIRKSLSDSGRFGMGESKHERKIFLHLGIGVGHGGGGVQPIEPKSCVPNYWGQLSGVNLKACCYSPWPGLSWGLALLLATQPSPPKKILPLYPFSPQWNYECYFLTQIPASPPSFLVPRPDF